MLSTIDGLEVYGFTTPTVAIEHIRLNVLNYDLVLSDFMMPEITGIELLTKIKELKPSVKALLMSAFDIQDDELFDLNKTYECGQCKTKPASFRECRHRSVVYGPCRDGQTGFAHVAKDCGVCSGQTGFHDGCRYGTYSEDYEVAYPNTDKEDN